MEQKIFALLFVKEFFENQNFALVGSNLTVSTLLNLPDRTGSLFTGVGELVLELWVEMDYILTSSIKFYINM